MFKKNKAVPEIHIQNKAIKKQRRNVLIPIKPIQNMIRLSGISVNGDLFIIVSIVLSIISGGVGYIISPVLMGLLPIFLILLEYIYLSNSRKNRLITMYDQLELFVKRCNQTKYTHIVDLIGVIYQDFEGSFRDNLESCYIEAGRTLDKDLALTHFKEKYDVKYLNFCLDTFQLIKGSRAADTIPTEFIESQTKAKIILVKDTTSLLINAKVDMCVLAICCSLVIVTLSLLFKLPLDAFIHNQISISLLTIASGLFIIGLFTTYKE